LVYSINYGPTFCHSKLAIVVKVGKQFGMSKNA